MADPILSERHVARFWSRVRRNQENGCLEWTGYRSDRGYGRLWVDGVIVVASRAAWALANGPVPPGMCVLHRCDNRPCVEVAHLFLGTKRDNAEDRDGKGRNGMSKRTRCPSGHLYAGGNLYVSPRGDRRCRECERVRSAAWRLALGRAGLREYKQSLRRRKQVVDNAISR